MTGCQVQKSGLMVRMWRGCAMKIFGCVNKVAPNKRGLFTIPTHLMVRPPASTSTTRQGSIVRCFHVPSVFKITFRYKYLRL